MAVRTIRAGAFTLIELLLVMVILVVLASVVVPRFTRQREQASLTKAKTDISMLETALSTFQINCGRFPTAEEGLNSLVHNPGATDWAGPYVKLIPNDPWGSSYIYVAPGEHFPDSFDLYSLGEDKRQSDDDMGNWQS